MKEKATPKNPQRRNPLRKTFSGKKLKAQFRLKEKNKKNVIKKIIAKKLAIMEAELKKTNK